MKGACPGQSPEPDSIGATGKARAMPGKLVLRSSRTPRASHRWTQRRLEGSARSASFPASLLLRNTAVPSTCVTTPWKTCRPSRAHRQTCRHVTRNLLEPLLSPANQVVEPAMRPSVALCPVSERPHTTELAAVDPLRHMLGRSSAQIQALTTGRRPRPPGPVRPTR